LKRFSQITKTKIIRRQEEVFENCPKRRYRAASWIVLQFFIVPAASYFESSISIDSSQGNLANPHPKWTRFVV